jgi:hypothetical protein
MGAEQEQAFDPATLKIGLMLTKPGYDLFLVHNDPSVPCLPRFWRGKTVGSEGCKKMADFAIPQATRSNH